LASAYRPSRAPEPSGAQGRKHQATPDTIAMLAHELRRRMAAVRVAAEAIAVLRGQGLETGTMLELLLGEIDDLDELASEVLGDPRRDRASEEPTLIEVSAAVKAAARTVALARGATVRVLGGVQAKVAASPAMLRQAIENLVDNAAANGGPDGVEVEVRADPAAGQVEVVVADRGGTGAGTDGHGIGLLMVRRFLNEAGGTSWVAPRDGGGTVVGLRMPLLPAPEPDPLDTAVNS
jgi:two-component system sensor histidine kinase MprB